MEEDIISDHLIKDDLLKNTVSQAFEYHISKSNFFKVAEKDRADAYMTIEIPSVQFARNSWDNSTKLAMRINATIRTKDNQIVWEDWGYISAFNSKLEKSQFSEFLVDKNTLKKGISIASQLTIQEFIEEGGGNPVALDHTLYQTNAIAQSNEIPEKESQVVRNTPPSPQVSVQDVAPKINSTPNPSSITARLKELKNMYASELITKEEYDSERKELLDEL